MIMIKKNLRNQRCCYFVGNCVDPGILWPFELGSESLRCNCKNDCVLKTITERETDIGGHEMQYVPASEKAVVTNLKIVLRLSRL